MNQQEFGPEALVFDAYGNPTFAPLPGEIIDEMGRPALTSPHVDTPGYREQVMEMWNARLNGKTS